MKTWLYLVAGLILYPMVTLAGMYPVPTSIKYKWTFENQNEFEVEWAMVDIPGVDVPPPSDYDTIILASRAAGFKGGMIFGGGRTNSAHASGNYWAISSLQPGETMASAAQRFAPGLPTAFDSMNYFTQYISDGCVGIVFMERSNGSWNNVFSPPGSCVVIPPPSEPIVSCDILTPSIALNHGEVGVGKTVSSIASADLSIDCRNAVSANIKFESSALKLGSMVATLSVPNAVNGNLQLNQGGNTLSVMSMLNGTALAVGTFTASTVMTITFN
ncbi:hypothetical protein PGN42_11510 [Klebsiella aerogenes]|uniref:hypothetical protein n=1 Tax=Klebsiella aerogenes TaxID=548 RepID=UPI002DB890A3|nr:hypothetical protein [Klebsiella aerogenes]MEB5740281.1 hypothetical protein [Klebsiella aerogenes]